MTRDYRTNRNLFSNYYLDEYLPKTEEWDEVSDDELQGAYDEITELWNGVKDNFLNYETNESQLENQFVRPLLEKLGIPYIVEESTNQTQRIPDYGFFESDKAISKAYERREEGGDFYKNAVAVADAKRWGRALDTRGKKQRDFENPSHQIDQYLRFTSTTWGVLTNGKKWRLYYRPTSHKLDSYYEVDLPPILENGDLEDFKYFYLFFRHEAFLEDVSGDSFLDDVYNESNVFAQELGEDLQDNIYEAIKILSEGFIQYSDNNLSEDDLNLIHDSSLIYLYRLIFVLYAESEGRDLLDTNNEIYEESYSLNTLKQDVVEELDSPSPKYLDWRTNLWDRLDELFKLIDQGSKSQGIPEEDLYIPAYNGGLFRTDPDENDSTEAHFLANHQVGDSYLAKVIELLTRSQNDDTGGKVFVDYSSLDVRELGSIYEGLLEYQLNVADEPLALEDGEYVSAGNDADVIVQKGEVYLTTDSGERKATGSYYTPEYVVEYIVENTLEPLVEDIRMDLAGQSARGEDRGFAAEFANRVFDLKILDPAMGSGHFLTSAIDYLSREIVDAQEKQARQEGIETIDEDHDINWARRQVAQRCIYGVDLNPLAVELSKVSLWLRTLAAEQPLAFLDHHLKTGNSLVGSEIETVLDNGDPDNGTEEGQLTLQESFDRTRRQALEHVTDQFEDLLAIDNETLDDIKEMEAVYEEVRDDPLYQHLIAIANVHTAEQFDLDVPDDANKRMAEALRDDSWTDIEGQDWYRSAQAMAENQRFFHWELEFPIAFYDQDGERMDNGGFDTVIGNPPYFRMNILSETHTQALNKIYPETYQGGSDILTLFLTRGVDLTCNQGKMGYIITRYFLELTTAQKTRDYILNHTQINTIVDFDGMQPFQGVSIQAVIPILTIGADGTTPNIIKLRDSNARYGDVATNIQNTDSELFERYTSEIRKVGDADSWTFYPPRVQNILDRVQSDAIHLKNIAEVAKSMESGRSSVLVVSPQEIEKYDIEKKLLKPIVKSGDVRRYYLEDNDDKLIWTEGIELEDYPQTKEYLEPYKEDLASRYDIKSRDVPWWYISNPRNKELFKHHIPRILTPYMSPHNRFYVDHTGYFNDGGDLRGIFPSEETNYSAEYLTAILNSKTGEFYHHRTSKRKDAGKYEYFGNVMNQFPIPELDLSGCENLPPTFDDVFERYKQGKIEVSDIIHILSNDDQIHTILGRLSAEMAQTIETHHSLNLSLLDYLGIPSDKLPDVVAGETLEDLQMPVAGVADTPLTKTTEDFDSLRVEDVLFENSKGQLEMSVDISYKVEEDDPRETDRWDRLAESEFETYEAMAFVRLSDAEETLLREFVPVAVEKAGCFAGFRDNATKTNSPLDRLKRLTLPDIDEVRAGLEKYIEVRERADELETKIEKIDQLIDEIVYDLYGLTDEEIEIVESAVQND